MPGPRRLLTAGLAVAAVHELLALVSGLVLHSGRTTWWLALSGALVAGVTVLAVRLIERPFPEPPGEDPAGPPPEEPPPWWPAFERDFRDHVAPSRPREPV
jgi:hypothetical protein